MERETGLEPATPSLEGLCSSQLSYSRPKLLCVCLRDRLSRLARGGEGRIRTSEGVSQRVYSPSQLTALVPLRRVLEPARSLDRESLRSVRAQKDPAPPSTPIPPRRSTNPDAFPCNPCCVDPPAWCRCRVAAPTPWARSWRGDSNLQPADYKSAALPIELRQRKRRLYQEVFAVPANSAPTAERRASAVLNKR